ncbi:MAG TPA: YihY/virulence factor BrkB family protein [Tepidisphaeraceae bacterium]|nr:YihY/virulence factor BrkB family protein [Tepidisphaeraceae bacterium]
MALNSAWPLVKQTFAEYSDDRIPRLSAALAYYALFALAPLLVIAVAVAGFLLGQQAASGELAKQLQTAVGPELAATIQSLIGRVNQGRGGIVATLISIAILLVGATSLFAELQDSLNTIWEVQPRAMGVWGLIRTRFLAFLMILGIAALLMASVVLSTILTGMSSIVGTGLGAQITNQIVSLAVFTLLFAMIFKWLPEAEIHWSDVWIGAAVTAVLFAIGRYLIGLYLARGGVGSVYGAAGSLVALLVWIYYSAQILFIGAEFTQVYSRRFGKGVQGEASAPPAPQAPSAPVHEPAKEQHVTLAPPARSEASPQQSKSTGTLGKFIPLAIGVVAGHFLLPRQTQPKSRRGKTTQRRFALTRIVDPGWRTRGERLFRSTP